MFEISNITATKKKDQMKKEIQEQLDHIANNLRLLEEFCVRNEEGLNSSVLLDVISTIPRITHYDPALAGDYFGRIGWTRSQGYPAYKYNWERTIDGVVIHLRDAETYDLPKEGSEVPPKAFPLMLRDVE